MAEPQMQGLATRGAGGEEWGSGSVPLNKLRLPSHIDPVRQLELLSKGLFFGTLLTNFTVSGCRPPPPRAQPYSSTPSPMYLYVCINLLYPTWPFHHIENELFVVAVVIIIMSASVLKLYAGFRSAQFAVRSNLQMLFFLSIVLQR